MATVAITNGFEVNVRTCLTSLYVGPVIPNLLADIVSLIHGVHETQCVISNFQLVAQAATPFHL